MWPSVDEHDDDDDRLPLYLRLTHKSPPPHITIPSAVDGQEQQDAELHQLPDAGDHPGQVSLTALVNWLLCMLMCVSATMTLDGSIHPCLLVPGAAAAVQTP